MNEASGSAAAMAVSAVELSRGAVLDFQEFFEAEYERLGRALYVLTGSQTDADELAQDAMVRVYERWSRVRTMDSPTGYLFRTAMNLYRSRLRQIKLRSRKQVDSRPQRDGFAAVEDRDELRRLISTLPLRERQALALVEVLGMTAEEAGRVLNLEPVSVRVRLSRARAHLRHQAGGQHDG
jgi:RNA polymerase sigma factor (sigma-70 family)